MPSSEISSATQRHLPGLDAQSPTVQGSRASVPGAAAGVAEPQPRLSGMGTQTQGMSAGALEGLAYPVVAYQPRTTPPEYSGTVQYPSAYRETMERVAGTFSQWSPDQFMKFRFDTSMSSLTLHQALKDVADGIDLAAAAQGLRTTLDDLLSDERYCIRVLSNVFGTYVWSERRKLAGVDMHLQQIKESLPSAAAYADWMQRLVRTVDLAIDRGEAAQVARQFVDFTELAIANPDPSGAAIDMGLAAGFYWKCLGVVDLLDEDLQVEVEQKRAALRELFLEKVDQDWNFKELTPDEQVQLRKEFEAALMFPHC